MGQRIYLAPTRRLHATQLFDASGLAFRRVGRTHDTDVAVVLPGSVADRVGIRPGDRLRRVNGQPVDALMPTELREMFSRDGTTVRLGLLRGDVPLVVTLILQMDNLRSTMSAAANWKNARNIRLDRS